MSFEGRGHHREGWKQARQEDHGRNGQPGGLLRQPQGCLPAAFLSALSLGPVTRVPVVYTTPRPHPGV